MSKVYPGVWWAVVGLVCAAGCTRPSGAAAPSGSRTRSSTVAKVPQEAAMRDLPEIRKLGKLRVLLYGENAALPRDGNPALQDAALAATFAKQLGVEFVPIWMDRYDRLIPALEGGDGDLLAAQMTVTSSRAQQVRFSKTRRVVSEVVVGRKDQADAPRSPSDLAGRRVTVRPASSYAETLKGLAAQGISVEIEAAPETASSLDILQEVSDGHSALTVVDDNIFASAMAFLPNLESLFSLKQGRQLAWAVRPDQPELQQAMDRYVLERALTTHTRDVYRADLDEIKRRRVLRVLTRNNAVSYFLYRGRQFGFDFELAQLIADTLDVRLQVMVAPSYDELLPWLQEGRADMVAASLTRTEERAETVRFSRPYMFVDEVLVKRAGTEGPTEPEDLEGTKVHVRRSSSFYETLSNLRTRGISLEIVPADETLETEELVEQVAEGKIDYTVADSHILLVEQGYGTPVESAFVLTEGEPDASEPTGKTRDEESRQRPGQRQIAFAVDPKTPKLGAFLDDFVERQYRGLRYNIAYKRYFESRRRARLAKERRASKTGRISPYDAVLQRYARMYGFDWRLVAAQAFVESRFDPKAESWVGAKGLLQVMPRTGRSMGFDDLDDVEQGVHAGVKYLGRLMRRFDESIPLRQRVRFALAAYNVGLGHVYDARRLAGQLGKDPDRWFGHVEKAMLLLSKPEYARKARHGYARGAEPVAYVSHIQSKYEAYVKVVP